MDLFEPTQTRSMGEKFYSYVVVNDFSRFSWVMFLALKDEAFQNFVKLANIIEREQEDKITTIMAKNLRIDTLWSFVKNMVFFINSLHLEPHNKMVLLKGGIRLFKRWLGPYF